MADQPLLETGLLQDTFGDYQPSPLPADLPNVAFRAPFTPSPEEGDIAVPSALSAIENSVLSTPAKKQITGGGIPRSLKEASSSRFDVFVPGDYNNEDAYAQGQGWPAKMVNGVGKGLLLTGTTLLQSTVGLLNGVARMTETGRAASFYDNEFNRKLDEINKAAEDVLPNYYTDVEKNARWYSPSKLFTANFLWDGIVKNLGFAAGAAISGGIFASALRAIPLTARLFSVGKAAEALVATEEALLAANKAAESYGKIKSLSDRFLSSYSALNPTGRALVAGLATTGEAGFEAFHNINAFRDEKIQEWKDSHGGQEPKGADLDAINAQADKMGNSSFMLNTSLLSATNYIQFPKILGSSYAAEKGIVNSLRKEVADISTDAKGAFVKTEASTRTGKLLSALNVIRPYTFSISEGFEEGAQFAISVGTEDYFNKKYDGDVASFLESLTEGVAQTFGTDEGMENILIGGLSGAIMLGRGKFQEQALRTKNTADAIQRFNKWKLSDFTKDTIDAVNRGTVLQKERETLLRQGDILESKDKEADYIINYLTPRIKYGRYDLVTYDIEEYKRIASTEEGFAQLQSEGKALAGDTQVAYLQRLDNLSKTAENVKSLYRSLQLRYGNRYTQDGLPVYSNEVMDKMIYAATKVADYDTRLPQLSIALSLGGIVFVDTVKAGKIDQAQVDAAIAQINELDVNSDVKDELKSNLRDYLELSLRRSLFIDEYNDIKKHPDKYKGRNLTPAPETATVEVKQQVKGKKKLVAKEIEVGREYPLAEIVRREGNTIQLSPKIAVVSQTLGGEFEVLLPSGEVTFMPAADFKQFNIADIGNEFSQLPTILDTVIDEVLSRRKYKNIPKPTGDKLEYVNSLDNKKLIDDILAEIEEEIEGFQEQQQQELKLAQDLELRKELLGSADPGVQTVISDKDYEPAAKKENLAVVTSTKPATKSTLPHHIRANEFGVNLDNFPNREKIKGVLVTSKNEKSILPGLTAFLKGTSDVDASKIIALVMVQDGKPVGVDGKILTAPSTENAIFQVMPDPSLTWSKEFGGGTMFRKETTPEQIEYFKKQYTQWVNETLASPSLVPHNISASFGIPEYVTITDDKGNKQRDYNAVVSVQEAGLIKPSDLAEKPLIFVPTVDTNIEKGSVSFTTPLGRPFLNLPNGYVKLQNRKLTKDEAATIYEAIHQLSLDIFKNGDAKSERSLRLIKWLRSIIYWGTPKNAAGFNSIFFKTENNEFRLFVSGRDKSYPFTPSAIAANKAEILTLVEGMYNNINSGLTDKPELWNAPYEEITNISPQGGIEAKQWKNYQTYLLSPQGRPEASLPLSTQMKPIKDGETNRTGVYFTLLDTVDKFGTPPTKPTIKPAATDKTKDIEKRRQEELKYNFGTNVDLIASKRKPVISRQIIYSDRFKQGTRIPTTVEEGDKYAQSLIDDYDKINAKYDKELAALQGAVKTAPQGQLVLDGNTINTYVSQAGKKILFAATSIEDVRIVKGGDLDEVLAGLTAQVGEEKAKENIKNTIRALIAAQRGTDLEMELTFDDEDAVELPALNYITAKEMENLPSSDDMIKVKNIQKEIKKKMETLEKLKNCIWKS